MLCFSSRRASPVQIPWRFTPKETLDRMAVSWTDKLQNWHPDKHEHNDQHSEDNTQTRFRHGTSYRRAPRRSGDQAFERIVTSWATSIEREALVRIEPKPDKRRAPARRFFSGSPYRCAPALRTAPFKGIVHEPSKTFHLPLPLPSHLVAGFPYRICKSGLATRSSARPYTRVPLQGVIVLLMLKERREKPW